MAQLSNISNNGLAPGQETPPTNVPTGGRVVNGCYYSDDELEQYSRQDFIEPMARLIRDAMPRVNAVNFVNRHLPVIMDDRNVNDQVGAWLNMWTAEISPNLRLEVALINAAGEIEYILPPPLGTIYTGNTGHKDSIEGRFSYLHSQGRRLMATERIIKSRIYNAIKVETDENRKHHGDWLRLLADSGYLDAKYPNTAKQYRSTTPTSVTAYRLAQVSPEVTPIVTATSVHPADTIIDGVTGEPVQSAHTSGPGGMDYD